LPLPRRCDMPFRYTTFNAARDATAVTPRAARATHYRKNRLTPTRGRPWTTLDIHGIQADVDQPVNLLVAYTSVAIFDTYRWRALAIWLHTVLYLYCTARISTSNHTIFFVGHTPTQLDPPRTALTQPLLTTGPPPVAPPNPTQLTPFPRVDCLAHGHTIRSHHGPHHPFV